MIHVPTAKISRSPPAGTENKPPIRIFTAQDLESLRFHFAWLTEGARVVERLAKGPLISCPLRFECDAIAASIAMSRRADTRQARVDPRQGMSGREV